MESKITPQNPITTNLDFAIQGLQRAIAELKFVDKSYPRAYEIEDSDSQIIPVHLLDNNGNYEALVPNDRKGSFSFIHPLGEINLTGRFKSFTQNDMSADVEIIFFGNVEEIFPEDYWGFLHTNLLVTLMSAKLKETGKFEMEYISEQSPRVYSTFKFRSDQRYYYYPYMVFKIVGKLFFDEAGGNAAEGSEVLGEDGIKLYPSCF